MLTMNAKSSKMMITMLGMAALSIAACGADSGDLCSQAAAHLEACGARGVEPPAVCGEAEQQAAAEILEEECSGERTAAALAGLDTTACVKRAAQNTGSKSASLTNPVVLSQAIDLVGRDNIRRVYVIGLQRNSLLKNRVITLTQCNDKSGPKSISLQAVPASHPLALSPVWSNGLGDTYSFDRKGEPFGNQAAPFAGLFGSKGPKVTSFTIQVAVRTEFIAKSSLTAWMSTSKGSLPTIDFHGSFLWSGNQTQEWRSRTTLWKDSVYADVGKGLMKCSHNPNPTDWEASFLGKTSDGLSNCKKI